MTADPVSLLPVLYEASVEPEQWAVFLQGLSDQVDARLTTLITTDESSQRCTLLHAGVDPEAARQYLAYYWSIDAFFAFAQQRGFNYPGSIAPAQAYVSDRELHATEYCNDFLLKFGVFHHCFALFGKNGLALTNLSAMRSIQDGAFGEREIRILRFIAPHVEQAIRLGERFTQLRMESKARKAALDQISVGVVFLDRTGKLLGANESASSVLAEQDGLSIRNGRLKATHPAEDRRLQTTIFQCSQTGAARGTWSGGGLLISRHPPAKPLQVVIGPACAIIAELPYCPSAVVFIHDLSARIRPRSELLRALYRLTPAESRLACLLFDGMSIGEITGLLGVTKNTVKTQIRSIFSKTGARRHADLVRVMMHLPVDRHVGHPVS